MSFKAKYINAVYPTVTFLINSQNKLHDSAENKHTSQYEHNQIQTKLARLTFLTFFIQFSIILTSIRQKGEMLA